MRHLEGKVAVVTGGASGIGLGMARRFADEGMRICLADVDQEALDHAAAQLSSNGADVAVVVTDVADAAAVERLAQRARDRFGTFHLVCNNAGVLVFGAAWELDHRTWDWVIGVNLWGVVNGIRAFLPTLVDQDEGHVVNTASMAGLLASPFCGPYTLTKHAVVGLTESLHHELAFRGSAVKVSLLCPGFVRTSIMPGHRPAGPGEAPIEHDDEGVRTVRQLFDEGIAGGTRPEELARLVVEAVREERFWILNDPQLADLAVQRFSGAAQGRDPGQPGG